MKSTGKLIVFIFTFLALTATAYAQSPREQLNQMVQQLQQTPNDSALRERTIKFATGIKPAPAIPEEALRREGRAKFAFKNAKSNDDYLGAAREYEEAVQVAPWVSGYYLDLCTIYEKAEKYAEAKRNCQLSLSGLNEPSQINEVKQRIAGLEFGIEKANSPQVQAAARVQSSEELVRSLNGVRFDCPQIRFPAGTDKILEHWLVVNGNELENWTKLLQTDADLLRALPQQNYLGYVHKYPVTKITGISGTSYDGTTYQISSDRITSNGFAKVCTRR